MTLQKLSDDQLALKVKTLRKRENEVLIELLEHIQEVERRRLHLRLGYSSMYKYLKEELGYSDMEAYTRIETSRFMKQVPECRDDLQSGAVTLSTVTELRNAVRNKEKQQGAMVSTSEKVELLNDIKNCTKREALVKLLERLGQEPDHIERLKPTHDGRWILELLLTGLQKSSLERAKDLLAHRGPLKNYAEVLSQLADQYLNKKDFTLTPQCLLSGKETSHQNPNATKPPKRISIGLSRAVFRRDQGRCQYRRPNGKICGSTYEIELDHIHPLSKGGKNVYMNLRCMCRAHNQYKGARPAEPGAKADATNAAPAGPTDGPTNAAPATPPT